MPPRRHHYVPKFYLNRFANKQGQIAVLDCRGGRQYTTSTVNAAVEVGFYDLVDAEGQISSVAEEFLSTIEGPIVKLLQDIANSETVLQVTESARYEIIHFLSLQSVRTPEIRLQKRVTADLLARIAPDLTYQQYGRRGLAGLVEDSLGRLPTEEEVDAAVSLVETFDNYRVQLHPNGLIQDMFDEADRFCEALISRPWRLVRGKNPDFITSDRPVTLWRQHTKANKHLGVGVETAERIYYPVDPYHVLEIGCDPSHDSRVVLVSQAEVSRINNRVSFWSQRFVFSRPCMKPFKGIEVYRERPIFHVNGIAVTQDMDVWGRIRQGFIDHTSVPIIHFAHGANHDRTILQIARGDGRELG